MEQAFLVELQRNYRRELFEALNLIASDKEQLQNQKVIPLSYLLNEFFEQWEDCYRTPKEEVWYQEAFTKRELEILSKFNAVHENIEEKMPQDLPNITEFITTSAWLELSSAANEALIVLCGASSDI